MSITTLLEGKYVNVNESFLKRLGYRREEVLDRTSLELGIWQSPRDRANLVRLLKETGQVRNLETRLRCKSGEERVWLSSAELIEIRGEQCILVTSSDITERKRVDEKLLELSGRLINAHEEERSRIARELHDDLNQRLALLSIELEHLGQSLGPATVEQRERARRACGLAQEIASDVRQLSHQLHPSKLDYLGLGAAVRGLCEEVSTRHGLRVEFAAREVPDDIPGDVALTLFRIAQESLRNVVRHSGAPSARVELTSRHRVLRLRVTDPGAGFDVAAVKSKGGLGLLSIEERLRLVGGELVIRSQPTRGTQIEARVPAPRQTR